ncbi:beta-lactamase hydrolase domain-containing protein [Arenicella xantha]|uniref:Sulfide:quinone oxidoreductase n=1 Tax=Arenicella xantha TaxID=644221 RepID=A0A395JGW9_9GAMM|nr:sulfur transferase domain-containing protein [Arenicella xantha]RBP48779.1 sulfide:quinone oxidoreductase [Arenicella xantha]
MHIEHLTTQVSASDQLDVSHIQQIADMGVELLVCNRPDGEDEGQTPFSEIAAEAERLGMTPILLPFSSYQITEANRDEFIKLIETRKRIHTYCRSGARCKRLWQRANAVVGGEEEYNQAQSA